MHPWNEFMEGDGLTDALGRSLEPFIPDIKLLEGIPVDTVEEDELGEAQVFKIEVNDAGEIPQEEEVWLRASSTTEASFLSIGDIMKSLAGEEWFPEMKTDGLDMGSIIELFEKKCFVQLSRLTPANIDACIKSDGSILAFVPEQEWCMITGETVPEYSGVPGMRTVEVSMKEDGWIAASDHYLEKGKCIKLDETSLSWLKDAWMLEVYK